MNFFELIFLWVLLDKNESVRWPRPQKLPRFYFFYDLASDTGNERRLIDK
nr:MAG TPA: hypothetical protein [Caudoviricetes sp.]